MKTLACMRLRALTISAATVVLLIGASVSLAGDRSAGARATPQRPAATSRHRPDHVRRPERPQRPADRPVRRETVVERTETGWTRNTTATNAEGETRTSTKTVTRDDGVRSVEIDRTGYDGRTVSVDRSVARTDDGHERSLAVTRPDGATLTREVSVSRDAEGNRVVEGTHTGFDGETRTFTRTIDGHRRPTMVRQMLVSKGSLQRR